MFPSKLRPLDRNEVVALMNMVFNLNSVNADVAMLSKESENSWLILLKFINLIYSLTEKLIIFTQGLKGLPQ